VNTKTVCKQLNVSQKALKIYEDLGIIGPKRDENNYRNYIYVDTSNCKKIRNKDYLCLINMKIPT
jgi:DNA-binding transcriptional MerR regulator